MKYILAALLMIVIAGCENRMSREKLDTAFYDATIDCYRCLALGKMDSVQYFRGKQDAFYEAIYDKLPPINKKPQP